ncbi:hypothetical protein KKH56_06795 [bacterium]|nr:hypothetical protein [bacterium]
MEEKIYQSNLSLLRKRCPKLLEELAATKEIEAESLLAKDGRPTLRIDGILLSSLYAPAREAKRLLSKANLTSKDFIIVLGFGLGYHLLELLNLIGDKTKILIVEFRPDLFKAALRLLDLTKALKDDRLILLFGKDLGKVLATLNDEDILSSNFEVIRHPPSLLLAPLFYRYVELILSSASLHAKRRNGGALSRKELLRLLIESLLVRNWAKGTDTGYLLDNRPEEHRRILFVHLNSIGEVIYDATPVIEGLREKFPTSEIVFLTEEEPAGTLRHNPRIDELIIFERQKWLGRLFKEPYEKVEGDLYGFVSTLSERGFDLLLNFHTSPRSAFLTRLIGARTILGLGVDRSGNPLVRGNSWMHHNFFTSEKAHLKAPYPVELHLLMSGVRPKKAGRTFVYTSDEEEKKADRILSREGFLVGLNCGSNFPARRWPKENFAKLADLLAREKGAKIIIFGGPDDLERACQIEKIIQGQVINLAGQTTLTELTALLKRCRLLVTNDTGPAHLASSAGTPCLTIAGPTWVGAYGPGNILLHAKIPCAGGCQKVSCRQHTCMKLITPEIVLLAVRIQEALLKEQGAERGKESKKLLSSELLKEVNILYSGEKKPDRLFSYYSLSERRDGPEIAEDLLRYASLNIWGSLCSPDTEFSPSLIARAIRRQAGRDKLKDIDKFLSSSIDELKEIEELCQKGLLGRGDLDSLSKQLWNYRIAKYLEYLEVVDYAGLAHLSSKERLKKLFQDKKLAAKTMRETLIKVKFLFGR